MLDKMIRTILYNMTITILNDMNATMLYDMEDSNTLYKLLSDFGITVSAFVTLILISRHGNTVLLTHLANGENVDEFNILYTTTFIVSITSIVNRMHGYGKLVPNMLMSPDFTEPINLYKLLWLLLMTDGMVKVITVVIKLLILLVPVDILPIYKRGNVFYFAEATSQLYRSLLTIRPWMFFLINYVASDKPMGIENRVLSLVWYTMMKSFDVGVNLQQFWHASQLVRQKLGFGRRPTRAEKRAAGSMCTICYERFRSPVRLDCRHIYCKECIGRWLNRQNECPLCRAPVIDYGVHNWSDGSTSFHFQFY